MRGRSFNKRVEVWEISDVADGFGGYTIEEVKITDSWAKVETLQPGKANNVKNFGLEDAQNAVMFTLRKRNDLSYNEELHFIKYRGKKYTISTAPTNINFEDSLIVFVGVAEPTKSNQTPITISFTAPTITVT